jgi:hypothetical protein
MKHVYNLSTVFSFNHWLEPYPKAKMKYLFAMQTAPNKQKTFLFVSVGI